MAVENILDFKAGDAVPEWLIYVDPKSPDAVRPQIRFLVTGSIVLLDNRYWLLSNETNAPHLIRVDNGSDCKLGALSHDLVIPCQFQIMVATEGTAA